MKVNIDDLIKTEHWQRERSLRDLEREHGFGVGMLAYWCRKYGIPTRTRVQQVRLTMRLPKIIAKRSGKFHWAWGRKRPDSAARMRSNNPMLSRDTRSAAATAKSVTYRKKLTPAEAYLFSVFSGRAVAQHPVGPYILDLAFIPEFVAIEVDGKNHWSKVVTAHDLTRDAWLISQGWRIFRVSNAGAHYPSRLVTKLKEMLPNLEITRPLPLHIFRGRVYQHGVLLRDAQNPAGIRL